MTKKLNSGERQVAETLQDVERWHLWRYEQALPYVKGKRVVDLGCGCGYGSYMLSEKAKSVIAYDDCEEAITFAKKYYPKNNIEYRTLDIMKVRTKYDVVVAFEVIEHIENLEGIWNKLSKIVKDNGRLILSVPHTSIPVSISKWHHRHYQRGEVHKFLAQRDFEIERLEMPTFENGLAVLCVARKCATVIF